MFLEEHTSILSQMFASQSKSVAQVSQSFLVDSFNADSYIITPLILLYVNF